MKLRLLDDDALLAHLVDEARLLAEALARCDPAAPVPVLSWDAQTVVMHTGAVHRWAADIVARRLGVRESGGSAACWPSATDVARLAGWLDEGAGTLISALRSAPTGLTCFTFAAGVAARTFWIRRQAHETAIHRADVEAAAGVEVTETDAAFAQGGLGEIIGAFATESAFVTHRAGRLLLEASDGPSWSMTFGGRHNIVASGELAGTDADVVVRGTSDELCRWAWNRPVSVATIGDREVLASWRAVRVEWRHSVKVDLWSQAGRTS